jgi:FkbM family methyltransferase
LSFTPQTWYAIKVIWTDQTHSSEKSVAWFTLAPTFGLRVLWVEPIAEIYDELVRNIANYPKQKAACAFLTDRDGQDPEFYVANNHGASSSIFQLSQHADIWPEVGFTGSRMLRSTRLDTLLGHENISPASYQTLVIDVQSAELSVIKGAGELLPAGARCVGKLAPNVI